MKAHSSSYVLTTLFPSIFFNYVLISAFWLEIIEMDNSAPAPMWVLVASIIYVALTVSVSLISYPSMCALLHDIQSHTWTNYGNDRRPTRTNVAGPGEKDNMLSMCALDNVLYAAIDATECIRVLYCTLNPILSMSDWGNKEGQDRK